MIALQAIRSISDQDYPAVFRTADDLARRAQRVYLLTAALYLIVLFSISILSVYLISEPWGVVARSFLLLLAVALTVYMAVRNQNAVWYAARALAESTKTVVWRYMMRTDPYDSQDNGKAEQIFTQDVREILRQNSQIAGSLKGEMAAGQHITVIMMDVRNLPWNDRLRFYIENRIANQKKWYGNKAEWNRRRSNIWFGTMILLLFVALALDILGLAVRIDPNHLPIEPLLAAAGGALTWIQVKRFRDLSAAYGLTAHEIGFLEADAAKVSSDATLSAFVGDAEYAFSREHTQWVARRS